MPNKNTGRIQLRLLNFEGKLVKNTKTGVRFKRSHQTFPTTSVFPTGRQTFRLPAFPPGKWSGEVRPARYQLRSAGFFLVRPGGLIQRDVWLPRNFNAKWNAIFSPWNQLGPAYKPLIDALNNSPAIVPRFRKPGGGFRVEPARSFAGTEYDNVDRTSLRMAKAGLLNLYAKMMSAPVPRGSPPWFNYVQRILVMQPDRFLAIVHPRMQDLVYSIWDAANTIPHYNKASAKNHRGNVPQPFKVLRIFSIKSQERTGVLQLTISDVEAGGQKFSILDADIDENGLLLLHFGDFIKHKFTTGTHPYHVYDILHTNRRRLGERLLLGYRLA